MTLKNRSFVFACALILAVPGFSSLLVDSTAVSEIEARSLAPMPGLDAAKAEPWSYFRKVDAYLDDHFGLRPQLLQFNGLVRRAARSPGAADVVVGRDGWLFFGPGLVTSRTEARGDIDRRVTAQAELLQVLSMRIGAGGGRFVVMIAPDKHTIYPEQLPWWLADHAASATYGKMVDQLRARGVTVVDVRPGLVATKAFAPTYQRTDTHWTPLGATVAFNQLMQALSLPAVIPDPPFVVSDATGPQFDLARKALMGNDHSDFRMREFTLAGTKPRVTPLSVPNDPGRQAYRSERPGEGLSMVILGDSFTERYYRNLALVPARRLTWLHHQQCEFDWPTVAAAKADVVVYQVVERNLGCDPRIATAQVSRVQR